MAGLGGGGGGGKGEPKRSVFPVPSLYPSISGQNGISIVWGASDVNSLPLVCTHGIVRLERGSGSHGNGAAGHVFPHT